MVLNEYLRQVRLDARFSKAELGVLSGIPRNRIRWIEDGKTAITYIELLVLIKVLDISLNHLKEVLNADVQETTIQLSTERKYRGRPVSEGGRLHAGKFDREIARQIKRGGTAREPVDYYSGGQ